MWIKEFNTKEELLAYKRDNAMCNVFEYEDKFLAIGMEGDAGFTEDLTINEANLVKIDTDPLACKIARLIQIPEYNARRAPLGHNYTTGLKTTMFPRRTFVRGELQRIEWFGDEEKTDLMLDVNVVYIRDPLGFAIKRTTTREWIREDGTSHPDSKVSIKTYDTLGQIQEGKRRRGNIVDNMQMPILGMMIATLPGMSAPWNTKTQPEIVQLGRDFLKMHQTAFSAFINESYKQILQDVLDATDPWLDNVINGDGDTIRKYILDEMNLEDDPTYQV